MEVLPINLTAIIGTIMGISVVLIPVIGLTARYALKPLAESLSKVLESRGKEESLQILEKRLGLMEAQIDGMDASLKRIEEATSFDARLRSGAETPLDRLPKP